MTSKRERIRAWAIRADTLAAVTARLKLPKPGPFEAFDRAMTEALAAATAASTASRTAGVPSVACSRASSSSVRPRCSASRRTAWAIAGLQAIDPDGQQHTVQRARAWLEGNQIGRAHV